MRRWLLVSLLLLGLLVPVQGGSTAAASVPIDPGPSTPGRPPLPHGVAGAARRPEPALPRHDGWPFPEAFPRTSGTGRYYDGAFFWTDFLYDDNGAISGPGLGESAGAWTFGTYEYPKPEQAGNGADIFRAAIAPTRTATWLRVDWNTLVRPTVPAAAFALDVDEASNEVAAWGGNVGLRARGIDHTVVMTSKGVFLDGARVAATRVDRQARSFVARIPRSKLKLSRDTGVYLAAGLANAAGNAFQSLGPEHRHLPGQPNVFNVAFRDYRDEPADKNFWFDKTQTTTLTQPDADVSELGRTLDWSRITRKVRQPQPFVRGWSNRWYVSNLELGQGRVPTMQSTADNKPNYLGRVQPYGVYVPKHLPRGIAAPLTWVLHSLTENHNQYSATAPSLLEGLCEKRGSICATTLGRGPDGYYRGSAELDFWEVWRSLHATYALDYSRTLIGGYSMGGFGTYNFALDHPDLFAGMFVLASAANEDLPRLENAKWMPYYHAHGFFDELVPYPDEAQPTFDEMDRLGYRYRIDSYPTKDHVVWSLEDGFHEAVAWAAGADRHVPEDPPEIIYRWFPREVNRKLGIGATGAWWVTGVSARDTRADEARFVARSYAKPLWPIERARSSEQLVDERGSPVMREQLVWRRGSVTDYSRRVTLTFDNVRRATVDLLRAELPTRPGSTVRVKTDGPVVLRLPRLPTTIDLKLDGRRLASRVFTVPTGWHTITLARRSR